MVRQFMMGGGFSICNIVIHALVMTAVVRASQGTIALGRVAAEPVADCRDGCNGFRFDGRTHM